MTGLYYPVVNVTVTKLLPCSGGTRCAISYTDGDTLTYDPNSELNFLNTSQELHYFKDNKTCVTTRSEDETFDWISTFLFTMVMCFSLPFNIVILRTFRMNSCLRKVHDLLVLNLSVFNLITVSGIPIYILFFTYEDDMFRNKYMCLFGFIPVNVGVCVTNTLMVALAVERYLLFKRPFQHQKITRCHVNKYVIVLAVVVTLYLLLPAMGWNRWNEVKACTILAFPRAFLLFATIAHLVLVLANLILHLFVLKTSFAFTNCILDFQNTSQREKFSFRKTIVRNSRAIKTVFYLAVISTTCWLPSVIFSLCYLTTEIQPSDRRILWQVTAIIRLSNTSVMPVVFALRNRHFRSALRGTIHNRRHECVHHFTMT